MKEPPQTVEPFAASLLHPTDCAPSGVAAFEHALALALAGRSTLTILHAAGDDAGHARLPSVRGALERWGRLAPHSDRSAVYDSLGVKVKKVQSRKADPVAAVLAYLEDHPSDLIVLATEGREGLARWVRPSTAERLARRTATATLFVPEGTRGMVGERGELRIRRMLVPIDHRPAPQIAIDRAGQLAAVAADGEVEALVVHVGEAGGTAPRCSWPDFANVRWSRETRSGEVVGGIAGAAEDHRADLIVMATEGHHGFLDAVRGSVTEQVLRRAPCPVLAVPAG